MRKPRKISTPKAIPAVKPVTKPVKPAALLSGVIAAHTAQTAAIAKASAKPVKPVPAVAVPTASVVTSAAKLAAHFCRKALAGPSKTAALGLSPRDAAYLRLLSITAKRTKTLSPRVIDIADDYVIHAAALFAAHASKPVLDDSVLRGRLPSLGLISQPSNCDNPDKATITLSTNATKLAIYTTA